MALSRNRRYLLLLIAAVALAARWLSLLLISAFDCVWVGNR